MAPSDEEGKPVGKVNGLLKVEINCDYTYLVQRSPLEEIYQKYKGGVAQVAPCAMPPCHRRKRKALPHSFAFAFSLQAAMKHLSKTAVQCKP